MKRIKNDAKHGVLAKKKLKIQSLLSIESENMNAPSINAPRLQFSRYETGENPQYSIIWMHGLGDEGASFHTLFSSQLEHFDMDGLPAIRFIFPNAPERPVTAHSWLPARAWFDIYSGFDESDMEDEQGILDSAGLIHILINNEKIKGIPTENIFLAGFSQGAAMALHTGFTYHEKLAGVIALSGYIPLRQTFEASRVKENQDTPAFIGHGTEDPVVPFSRGENANKQLLELGYNVEFHPYDMDHTLDWQEIQDMLDWLKKVINK